MNHRLAQLAVVLMLVTMVFAVFDTLRHHHVKDQEKKQPIPTLPSKCGMYYNDGTERWKECMNVGYV